jgi:uncharacterized membrane protein
VLANILSQAGQSQRINETAMRVLMFFIDACLWLSVFIVPAGIVFFIAFLLYNKSSAFLPLSIIITAIGMYLGFRLAEYIRKKYGLLDFFAKLLSTPELEEKNSQKSSHQE